MADKDKPVEIQLDEENEDWLPSKQKKKTKKKQAKIAQNVRERFTKDSPAKLP